jgi:hypothetical protein
MRWFRSRVVRVALIIGALAIAVLATVLAIWSSTGSKKSKPRQEASAVQLNRAWQEAHCPREAQANLAEIVLPRDSVADVEILDVPDGRIYVPRPWTETTRHFHGPSPDGMSARTGGAGTFEPWRGPGTDDPCRGQVYRSVKGKRADDPRFTLDLIFRRYSTRSPDGHFEVQQGKYPFAYQVVEFAFFGPENADPDELPLLKLPRIETAQVLGDGWSVVKRDTRSLLNRIAFDTRDVAREGPVSKAVEVREGWALVVPIADHVRAKIVLGRGCTADAMAPVPREGRPGLSLVENETCAARPATCFLLAGHLVREGCARAIPPLALRRWPFSSPWLSALPWAPWAGRARSRSSAHCP